jgi:hypothetical protein
VREAGFRAVSELVKAIDQLDEEKFARLMVMRASG